MLKKTKRGDDDTIKCVYTEPTQTRDPLKQLSTNEPAKGQTLKNMRPPQDTTATKPWKGSILEPLQLMPHKKAKCPHCSKVYAYRSGLSKHLKKNHNDKTCHNASGYLVCHQCNLRFLTIKDLMNHLDSVHGAPVQTKTLTFPNFSNFMAWKEEEELITHSNYVQQCAPQIYSDKQHWYFYCNRSGCYRSTTKGIRHIKGQGSCKIGERCIAHMKAVKDMDRGEVIVYYCYTHHNHEISMGHLRIQEATRTKIAAQLQQGVTIQRIMDDVQDSTSGGITREHLVTKQDIHNIKNQYNIDGVMRHANDHMSVCAWVKELETLPYNPILVFKPQGELQPHGMDNVGKDDFLLRIQTQFQRDMLIKYGHMCVCMDATHGTNMYDFNLITLLIVDEFGEGIPVAWAISNREDVTLLVEFLGGVKKRTGSLKPKWFMSDDAQQYYNAWSGVFDGTGTNKLLCAWHVDRAWRASLNVHVKNKQNKIEIYHHLRVLLMENEEREFRVLLQKFVSSIDHTENRFSKYFKEHYCNRTDQWASCFRANTIVNTNMFLEAFHRTLKVVYLQQKQNRRIDFLIHILLKIAKDRVFDQLTKLEKGKFTHRVSEINKRHRSATNMDELSINITKKDENTWIVPSERDPTTRYTIKRINETCDCKLRCSTCKVCVHLYLCTCMDSLLHATVCKHVHLVKIKTEVLETTTTTTNNQSNVEYFSSLLDTNVKDGKLVEVRQKLLHKLSEMNILVRNCEQIEALKTASKHLISAQMAIKSWQEYKRVLLPTKRKIPPNKNAEKQARFFSTKKQRRLTGLKLSKPSHQEINRSRLDLITNETTCCGICFKENDNTNEEYGCSVLCVTFGCMRHVFQDLWKKTTHVKYALLKHCNLAPLLTVLCNIDIDIAFFTYLFYP